MARMLLTGLLPPAPPADVYAAGKSYLTVAESVAAEQVSAALGFWRKCSKENDTALDDWVELQ